ncbi:hypothetical protein Xentx_01418 [Xenorhabdus thuongxuanensis]|uniref:Uncharacterized protein n=1 Tax=Xenorhabdus thuongxuanensis TaxID=1873484 RepID=A0A1Q5U588_9GAMM|nr:hypothetical protein Xentx_01418 [Xenorhabdus thuongxuanensis]
MVDINKLEHGGHDEWPLTILSFMIRSCKLDVVEA